MMNDEILRSAVSTYGTPLYVYDLDVLKEKILWLKKSIIPESNLFFSMKANPLPYILKIVYDSGCGVEIASGGELDIALKVGVKSQDIIFSGPGKTDLELEKAIKNGIGMINVESIQELRKIDSIAERLEKKVSIALRINPIICESTSKIRMSGIASQFGIEESDLTEGFFKEVKNMKNIILKGIHIYMGTSILEVTEICRNTEYAIRLGVNLAKKFKFRLGYLNVGGGFGVPYFKNEGILDLKKLTSEMKKLKEKYHADLRGVNIFFESGRFILAECGVFLTKVLYRKVSKGRKYLVCDGGANFHSASAFLGRFVRNNFPMHVLGKKEINSNFYVTGPLCTPTDLIGQNVQLSQNVDEDDIIVIENSGAYGLTYSPYGFLSHDLPKEIAFDKRNRFYNMSDERG